MDNAELVNAILAIMEERQKTIYISSFTPSPPTQQVKPSAHSSRRDNYQRLVLAYPPPEFEVVGIAATNSMEPLLDDDCNVVLEILTPGVLAACPLSLGDICTYRYSPVMTIIHRLEHQNPDGSFFVQGDNNFLPDMTLLKPEQFLGRVVVISYGLHDRPGD